MLHFRLVSATALITLAGLFFGLDFYGVAGLQGGVWLLPLLLLFAIGTAREFALMVRGAGRLVRVRIAIASSLLAPALSALPMLWELVAGESYPPNCPVGRLGWLAVGTVLGVILVFAREMSSYQPGDHNVIDRCAWGALIASYVGLPMAFLVVIRDLGASPTWGLAALVSLIAVTKASDTGAYFSGKALGRHKLIPRLSPGKTWEGAVGGVLASIGVAYLACFWIIPGFTGTAVTAPWWGPVLLGSVCAVAGMFGDLAESLVKRDMGVKDSGNTLPGMGGIWDVTDSLIGASLPGFLCFVVGAAGQVA